MEFYLSILFFWTRYLEHSILHQFRLLGVLTLFHMLYKIFSSYFGYIVSMFIFLGLPIYFKKNHSLYLLGYIKKVFEYFGNVRNISAVPYIIAEVVNLRNKLDGAMPNSPDTLEPILTRFSPLAWFMASESKVYGLPDLSRS